MKYTVLVMLFILVVDFSEKLINLENNYIYGHFKYHENLLVGFELITSCLTDP